MCQDWGEGAKKAARTDEVGEEEQIGKNSLRTEHHKAEEVARLADLGAKEKRVRTRGEVGIGMEAHGPS